MKFRIEFPEVKEEDVYETTFEFEITFKQIIRSLFERVRIRSYTVESTHKTLLGEQLRQYLLKHMNDAKQEKDGNRRKSLL